MIESNNENKTGSIESQCRCMSKNCNLLGNNQLKIIYINKIGYFCNSCKIDLLNLGLVFEVTETTFEGNHSKNQHARLIDKSKDHPIFETAYDILIRQRHNNKSDKSAQQ